MKRALVLLAILTACPAIRAPEDRAREELAQLEKHGIWQALPDGGQVVVAPGALRFTDLDFGPEGDRGTIPVFVRLSAEGRMDGTPFSYLGTETLTVACQRATCSVEKGPQRLWAILSALRARRLILAQGGQGLSELAAAGTAPEMDPAAVSAAAARTVAAWFIRVDRSEAVVGEADPGGVQHRLTLHQEGDAAFRFVAGLP